MKFTGDRARAQQYLSGGTLDVYAFGTLTEMYGQKPGSQTISEMLQNHFKAERNKYSISIQVIKSHAQFRTFFVLEFMREYLATHACNLEGWSSRQKKTVIWLSLLFIEIRVNNDALEQKRTVRGHLWNWNWSYKKKTSDVWELSLFWTYISWWFMAVTLDV